jgi:hypothetical protein
MRRTGKPAGMPRIDGEQAAPAQKGATYTSHGQPAGVPRGDGEQAGPAQKETIACSKSAGAWIGATPITAG